MVIKGAVGVAGSSPFTLLMAMDATIARSDVKETKPMSIDLTREVESWVRQRAAAEGVSVNDLLARTFAPEKQEAQSISDPKAHVQALRAKWQTDDQTPELPPVPMRQGETPTEALFRTWEEEDASLTDEERQAEDRLWEEFQKNINAERTQSGMRTIF